MNLPKQLINLVGIVVVAGVIVAGLALVALPMWSGAQTTEASVRSVAQTNDVYAIQVDTLVAADSRMDEITRELAELRREIAGDPQLDDVFEIVVAAATGTGAVIESVTAGEIAPWTPREPVTAIGEASPSDAPPTEEPSPEPDEAVPDAEGTVEGGEQSAPTDGLPPQQQVPVTIEVTVVDAAAAAAFVDALGRGPRLLAPVDATLDDGTLIVTALAFIRTED